MSQSFRSIMEKRRTTLQPENVVLVTLASGIDYDVVPGSYTEENDPTIVGSGGQVTFAVKDDSDPDGFQLVLTYAHHIVALQYSIPGLVEEVLR